jgi:hypothetical protein
LRNSPSDTLLRTKTLRPGNLDNEAFGIASVELV